MIIHILNPDFFVLNCKTIAPGIKYENYLVEVLNNSINYFALKHPPYDRFQLEKNQSNGESDAVSSTYSIDFKLLVDQDYMHAMAQNKPDVDMSRINQGYIFVTPKANKTFVPRKNILVELAELKECDLVSKNVSDSILNLLDNLTKNKNLFFYYPYEFCSKMEVSGISFVKLLNQALSLIMKYRTNAVPQKDTFLCIKANSWFYIYQWTKNGFLFIDQVNELLCSKYRELKQYSILYQ